MSAATIPRTEQPKNRHFIPFINKCVLHKIQSDCPSHLVSCKKIMRGFSLGIKGAGREGDLSPPSSLEVIYGTVLQPALLCVVLNLLSTGITLCSPFLKPHQFADTSHERTGFSAWP
jgi:hypothetical protein